jgi:Uma2 family endonuclease
MTRAEFHTIYDKMPDDFQAELVGGVVYVASPRRRRHGTCHVHLGSVLATYAAQMPGTEVADNATILLGDDGEPQPDLFLRILPEFGGQSQTTDDDYVAGKPEFVLEVAASSRAVDLHAKYDDYRRYGVLEYVVVCIQDRQFHWFDLRRDCELDIAGDRVLRVRTFPGLWINSGALWADNHAQLLTTLQQGLATTGHAEFAMNLAARSCSGN